MNKRSEIPDANLVSDAKREREREKYTYTLPTNSLPHTPYMFLTFFKMVRCEITFTTYLMVSSVNLKKNLVRIIISMQ